jgi:outer membrane protein TolC
LDKISPEISNTSIESAKGEFDTRLQASASASTRHSSTLGPRAKNSTTPDDRVEGERVSRSASGNVSLGGRLPTGTDYSIGFGTSRSSSNSSYPFYDASLNLNITQNLLKGAGSTVNLIRVWTAENNFVMSLYQLQQAVINLVTDTQNAYWDLYLARKTLDIRLEGYRLAKDQRKRSEELVRVGRSTPLGLFGAQAEESARISDVINAAADVKRRHIQFLRLLNPEVEPKRWQLKLFPIDLPQTPTEPLIPEQRVAVAGKYRPDLRQAEIDLASGELEVVRTANGLLPALDFVTELGDTGVGDTFGDAAGKVRDREFPNWRLGLQFSYPLQNRTARAAHRRANFSKQQSEEAIANYRQIIEVDVRLAINEIERTGRLIESTKITRRLREAELAAEIERFHVGRSTQLLVAQSQRDLTSSQVDEVSAVVANIKAYLQLYKAEGSTLQRSGIQPVMITPESGVGRH